MDGLTNETFIVSLEANEPHYIGDVSCREGWCGTWGYPLPCVCGGLIHADFLDESFDAVILAKKCDKCGDAYKAKDG